MMDRSELVRYANDTLLEEFQQRLTIQIRYIDNQIAMLKKELKSLDAERTHLSKFFPEAEAPPKLSPQLNPNQDHPIPTQDRPTQTQEPMVSIPSWLQQDKKAAE